MTVFKYTDKEINIIIMLILNEKIYACIITDDKNSKLLIFRNRWSVWFLSVLSIKTNGGKGEGHARTNKNTRFVDSAFETFERQICPTDLLYGNRWRFQKHYPDFLIAAGRKKKIIFKKIKVIRIIMFM